MHRVTISDWGPHAQRFVERRAAARLAAVCARSFYLESRGDFFCIGEEGIGRGPLNAIVSRAEWARLSPRLPPVGVPARIAHGVIHIDVRAFDGTRAKSWRPAAWPSAAGHGTGTAALHYVQRAAEEQAPADGLARIVLGMDSRPCSALERIALPRVQRLSAWMAGHSQPPVDLL